ncbi:MAG: SDR family NAD(P)-dependent oxidoreductase [Eubacteriales bacterium]|nr:SDR family NAD(P)-dependent oxidoreductase [Eubacteriales bacterium]
MKIDLSGQVAIVTGAYGGIGEAMCRKYIKAGAIVVAVGRDVQKGKALEQQLKEEGGDIKFIQGDVSIKEAMVEMCAKAVEAYGKIDILVNNAGVNVGPGDRKYIHEFSDEQWHRIINIDLNGVYYCSKPVIKEMIKHGKGKIINISSVVGQVPFRNQCAFTAAKAGVINLTKAMAIELADFNIQVNCICPGSTMVPGLKDLFYNDEKTAERMLSHIPMHRTGEPDEIAGATIFLSSDEASYITGNIMTIDGGWIAGYARDF